MGNLPQRCGILLILKGLTSFQSIIYVASITIHISKQGVSQSQYL